MKKARNYIMFIAAMMIFGTNGLLVAHISLGGAEIVLLRTLLGSLILSAVVICTKSFSMKELRDDFIPASIGGAALGLNWVALFVAYRSAGVSLSTLTYYCGPVLVLALSPILFKEKLTAAKIAAVAAVVAGMIFITGNIVAVTELSKGIFCAALAAVFYAVLIISGKKITHLSGLNCAAYELWIAFFVVLIYLAVTGAELPVIPARSDVIWVLIIGFVNTGLAYFLYFSALQKLPGQTVALVCYIDPLTALLVSALFLDEKLVPLQIVGAVLILGGAMLGEIKKRKEK